MLLILFLIMVLKDTYKYIDISKNYWNAFFYFGETNLCELFLAVNLFI